MTSTKNKNSSSSQASAEMKKYVLLCEAIDNNRDIKIIQFLLKSGSNVNSSKIRDCDTPLHYAVKNGNRKIAAMLLDKGAKVDARNQYGATPLHTAAASGSTEMVELLLRRGATIDAKNMFDETPLYTALLFRRMELEVAYLQHANLQFYGSYNTIFPDLAPFRSTTKKLHSQVVIALLDYGADINIMNGNKYSTLDTVRFADVGCDFCSDILKQHIVKMKTAKMYLTEKNLLLVSGKNELNYFQNLCEEEIEWMKCENIGNSTVSYYDILTKSINLIAIWARNDKIVEVLKVGDYRRRYFLYASMINSNFWKGLERKELLEQSNKLLCSLIKSVPELPYNCIDKIFSYLNNKDLKKFITKQGAYHSYD